MAQTDLIKRIRLYKSRIRLREPFVISLGSITHAENVIVLVETASGLQGFGECSPFMTIHGESMESAFIAGRYLAAQLKNKDALALEARQQDMNTVMFGNASIKSAFDIALHDVASLSSGMPLYAFLGGKKNKPIVTDYTVSIGEPAKMASDALQIIENGFSIIKVKLGGSGADDVERIRRIRLAVGDEPLLRIDANQGWKSHDAVGILKALHPFGIQHCEEPIPRWDFMELPRISNESPIPIMADESCFDHHDAKRLIGMKACNLLNVKLGKSAGILNAMKITRLAEKAGVYLQAGGFLESRIGFTATAHFATVSDHIRFFDFDTPLMFEHDPMLGGISYHKGGMIEIPDENGLGTRPDESYLRELDSMEI